MTIFETYQDLVDEINLYLIRIRQYKLERKKLLYSISGPSGYGSGGTLSSMGIKGTSSCITMEDILLRIEKLEHNLIYCEEMLNLLQQQKKEIDSKLATLDGNLYKVFYWHRVKNKTFEDIGLIIGKSKRQVSRYYQEAIK